MGNMARFAQINADDVCVGVSNLGSGAAGNPRLIQIAADEDPLGKRWNGSAWVNVAASLATEIDSDAFIDRWTIDELVALKSKVRGPDGARAEVYWDLIIMRGIIQLDSALVAAARADMVDWGILTTARADEVFG